MCKIYDVVLALKRLEAPDIVLTHSLVINSSYAPFFIWLFTNLSSTFIFPFIITPLLWFIPWGLENWTIICKTKIIYPFIVWQCCYWNTARVQKCVVNLEGFPAPQLLSNVGCN